MKKKSMVSQEQQEFKPEIKLEPSDSIPVEAFDFDTVAPGRSVIHWILKPVAAKARMDEIDKVLKVSRGPKYEKKLKAAQKFLAEIGLKPEEIAKVEKDFVEFI